MSARAKMNQWQSPTTGQQNRPAPCKYHKFGKYMRVASSERQTPRWELGGGFGAHASLQAGFAEQIDSQQLIGAPLRPGPAAEKDAPQRPGLSPKPRPLGEGVAKLRLPWGLGAGHHQNRCALGEVAVSSEASALGAVPQQRPQHPRREVVRSRRWLWALSRHPPGSFWAGRLGLRAPRTMWFWCGDDRVCPSHAGVCRHPVAAGGSPAAIPGGPLAPAPPVWSCFVAPRLGGRPHRGPRGGTLRTKLLVAQAGTRLPRRRGASSACVALSSALPARLFTEVGGAEGSTHRCGDTALPGRPWRSAQAGPQVPKGHASCWVMASFFITRPPRLVMLSGWL